MKLTHLTIAEASQKLASKEISAVELAKEHLRAASELAELNAYVALTEGHAMTMAQASDTRRAAGQARGPMDGIPVAVKDLFCTKGARSWACSKILEGFTPTYESTVTQKLFACGAVMLGKTNMDEFAMDSTNGTSYDGPVINPWIRQDGAMVVPGGSSGGSAAAVAARIAMGALGSDTGGSIRQPAAFTGTVGIKPTYGRCSRYGMIAFASSLDQAGVFARTVEDAAIMLEAICGHDPKDATCAPVPVPVFKEALGQSVRGLRIGIPKEYVVDGMPDDMLQWWEKTRQALTEAGAQMVEISLPHTHHALPAYYVIAPAEASSNLARYDGVRYGARVCDPGDTLDMMYGKTRAAGFGREVKRRILVGTYVLSAGYYDAYYKKALRIRTLIKQDFDAAFEKVDAILTPATPTPAFSANEPITHVNMFLNDVFTVPVNLAGLPGLVLPVGLSESGRLPLGMQLIGRPFDESTLFTVASVLEQAFPLTSLPQRVAA